MEFWQKGLKFTCKRCLYCCSGEPGFVFLQEEDVKNISEYLKISGEDFLMLYTRKVEEGGKTLISLKEKSNYRCVFLTKEGCAIYPVRPVQCATYPFWPGVLKDEKSWNEEKSYCPGIGEGELIPPEEIEKRLEATKNRKLIIN
jgi:Predicted Fe-S-cluster oxidoreductase